MKTRRIMINALKNLAKFKVRSFLMMIGIVIGILALTMVVSIGLGAKNQVMERVKKFGLESLMIHARKGLRRPTAGMMASTVDAASSSFTQPRWGM